MHEFIQWQFTLLPYVTSNDGGAAKSLYFINIFLCSSPQSCLSSNWNKNINFVEPVKNRSLALKRDYYKKKVKPPKQSDKPETAGETLQPKPKFLDQILIGTKDMKPSLPSKKKDEEESLD